MTLNFRLFILLLLGLSAVGSPHSVGHAIDVSEAALVKKYGKVGHMSARVEQTKTSPYLFKPMKSKVNLNYTPEEIIWEYTEPFKKVIRIRPDTLVTEAGGAGGATKTEATTPGAKPARQGEHVLPLGEGTKIHALMSFLRALFGLDFSVLKKDFDLTFTGHQLRAVVKKQSQLTFIESLSLVFDENLVPQTLEVISTGEKLNLRFVDFIAEPLATKGQPNPALPVPSASSAPPELKMGDKKN